jgi:hypothetical protein
MKPILEGISAMDVIRSIIDNTSDSKTTKAVKVAGTVMDTFAGRRGLESGNGTPYLGGSISNYANDLIMTFPMLIDNSLSPDLCSMLSKASERNIVTMLHLLFSSAQLKGSDGREIVKSIYGNVKTNMDLDEYIDAVNDFVGTKENYSVGYVNRDKEMNRIIDETVKSICKCVKEGKIFLPAFDEYENLNETALTEYTVTKDRNDEIAVTEAKARKNQVHNYDPKTGQMITDINNKVDNMAAQQQQMANNINQIQQNQQQNAPSTIAVKADRNGLYQPRYPESNLLPDDMRNYNDYTFKSKQIDRMNLQNRLDQARDTRDTNMADFNKAAQNFNQDFTTMTKRILDTDIKKANELQPTLMVVNYVETIELTDQNGNKTGKREEVVNGKRSFVCGVKSRLVSVEPIDIIERIVSKNKTRLSFINFIRATTGEIKFKNDFILSLKQAKIDAKNSVKKGEAAKIWKSLEVLSAKNNLNKMRKSGNDTSAITTLVINKETANLMKKQYRIDIEKASVAKAMLDAYNLLAIFIVDESVEVVKTLYRGNQMFDQQAFSYLEREENDKSYKKVINLIGQMNR